MKKTGKYQKQKIFYTVVRILVVLLFGVLTSCDSLAELLNLEHPLISLEYPNAPETMYKGKKITKIEPILEPKEATVQYKAELPKGLTIDSSSGVISGTPSGLQSSKSYVITVTGEGLYIGVKTAIINIEVTEVIINGVCDPLLDNDGDGKLEITNEIALQRMSEDLDGDYELIKDIEMIGDIVTCSDKTYDTNNFQPIGFNPIRNDVLRAFTGTLDGNGYTISNLSINRAMEDNVGLFGKLDGATIQNLVIDHAGVSGKEKVGVLAGYVEGSTIENVGVISTTDSIISATDEYAGGLIGMAVDSKVTGYALININSSHNTVGGLLGEIREGIVTGYVKGTVTGNDYVGGLVGNADDDVTITGYMDGSVNGTWYVGGVIGFSGLISSTVIVTGYAKGSVTGDNYVGGLAGSLIGGTLTGYARSTVTRAEGSADMNTRFGLLAGDALVIGYHSVGESKIIDVQVVYYEELDGIPITMRMKTTYTDFSRFTFGVAEGKWTWVEDGQWPAINIGDIGALADAANEQPTERN